TPPTVTAKQATSVIPIVFAALGDPVGAGVVKSLARPGGNATGLSLQATDATGKRLSLLGEVIQVCAGWRLWPIAIIPRPLWRCVRLSPPPAHWVSKELHRKSVDSKILRPRSMRLRAA